MGVFLSRRLGPCRVCRALILACVTLLLGNPAAFAEDPSETPVELHVMLDRLIDQLDADAFLARSAAADDLVTLAVEDDASRARDLDLAFQRGSLHPSLEVRIAIEEVRHRIRQVRRDRQLACLLNPRCDSASVQLPGWSSFSRLVGSELPARRLFARTIRRFPQPLSDLEFGFSDQGFTQLIESIDPYRLPSEDTEAWTLVIMLDLEARKPPASDLTSRLAMALCNSAMGPKSNGASGENPLRRLIGQWLRENDTECATRERLLIAMRYGCQDLAWEVCAEALADRSTSPSTQVTALLTAATLDRGDIEFHLRDRLDDQRTAHVWQLIATRKTKIRTQVRDVALALLLHHHKIDPRPVGFGELQADPLFLYRDHSLGFPDDDARRKAFTRAMRLIEPLKAR